MFSECMWAAQHATTQANARKSFCDSFLPFKMSSEYNIAQHSIARTADPVPRIAAGAGLPGPAAPTYDPFADAYAAAERERIQRCPRHRRVEGPHGGALGYSPNTFGDYHWSVPACSDDCPWAEPKPAAAGAGAPPAEMFRLADGAGMEDPDPAPAGRYELTCQPAFANGPPPGWYNPACPCSRCRAAAPAETK